MGTVREFMSVEPAAVTRDTPASEAARVMRDSDVGILPVVEEGVLQGVVTDRDLAVEALGDRGDVPVADFMSAEVITISPDDSVEEAQRLMSENDVRRLVVCDGNRLVGMVSVGDLAVRVSDAVAGEVLYATGPEPTEPVDRGGLQALESDARQAGSTDKSGPL